MGEARRELWVPPRLNGREKVARPRQLNRPFGTHHLNSCILPNPSVNLMG